MGNIIYTLLYIFCWLMRAIGWWRWRLEGRENLPPRKSGGMIIVMNHVHWIDISVIGATLPLSYRLSWLGKAEIFQHPVTNWLFRTMYVIPIHRGQRDLAALDAAERALRNGAVLLVFPEGTRNRNGVLRQGRGGAVRMAMRSGVPIVPVAILGSERGARGTLCAREVRVLVGKPYTVAPIGDGVIPREVMEQLTTDMMTRIALLLPEERRGYYAEAARARLAASEPPRLPG